ncbi:hypothetical protein WK90_05590 [Burkholderia cepacia]|nr:hypothetical protein WJ46_30180 [Burkholderia cepacia]KVQ33707.1 hypothetical protein WK02_09470 [Burkholderia cepacia]KVV52375.1 hypothetical protein WK83_27335 [Burkholderia cepacia]KVV64403.1 hypothetical protein WK85_30505 [Burkholderia cepacia]KVV68589.1 hypothetical protein WK84_19650 [Burkholderia cepacia]
MDICDELFDYFVGEIGLHGGVNRTQYINDIFRVLLNAIAFVPCISEGFECGSNTYLLEELASLGSKTNAFDHPTGYRIDGHRVFQEMKIGLHHFARGLLRVAIRGSHQQTTHDFERKANTSVDTVGQRFNRGQPWHRIG